jgi:hypothetical protein
MKAKKDTEIGNMEHFSLNESFALSALNVK